MSGYLERRKLASEIFAEHVRPHIGTLFGQIDQAGNLAIAIVSDAENRQLDDVQIIEEENGEDAFAAYYADGNKSATAEPEFNSTLGLAVEKLKDGVTLNQLWNVIS